ncbi:tetratricopeptide repeat protein [Thiobacillus sp.]|uniref:tetratricopeptide repeat protein n=1 Tax=Thiobacillus sp. TaxID=924 RepID=UPI0025DD0B25|nr:tetratricopeptide repeat protein [Thiobacillus sp.]
MPLVCPKCGSDQIRSAALHAHDGVRRMLLHKPLRCRECRHRFWVFSPLKPLLLLAGVGALVGVTAWFALDQHTPAVPAAQEPDSLPHTRAEQGDAEAQLQLGLRYAEGDGVIQNDKEAAKWFAMAAQQGLAEAQYQYGLALLEGRGVVQDYRAAFSWLEKPAQRGYAKAQYSLGELYRYGTGTAIDKARAYLWFNLAAAQGVDAAAKARDSLVWQLKPEQIAAMQEEARQMSRNTAAPAAAP